ncbi:MAG: NfeD family protein [Bacteroidales bacterium]|jgi:membrane-bound serine protease (ClpP class)|nr:NfeD family protein [Bacteroidales bacterium]
MKKGILFLMVLLNVFTSLGQQNKKIYFYEIDDVISKPAKKKTEIAIKEADNEKADIILLRLNTFGGELEAADQIRTMLMKTEIPVFVFIDVNAASAGALISIACDSIYMAPGASIGAASVVNETGEIMPDKYQSYMRSLMRSTAEKQGRDPDIAQAMVDPDVSIDNIIDSGKVLTFTTAEAIKYGFCEAQVSSKEGALEAAGIHQYTIVEQKLSWIDQIILFLIKPAISGLLIMLIVGGIYFELQSPGIGFPLVVAIIAALLFFAPHYLGGLAQHWEILIFIVGLILLVVEIFVIPGFGVFGIVGIVLIVASLVLAMIFNINFDFSFTTSATIFQKIAIVITSLTIGFGLSIWLGKKLILADTRFGSIALKTELSKDSGFLSQGEGLFHLVGKKGITTTILRPSGKVQIDDESFDAISEYGIIEKGTPITAIKFENSQLIVRKD